MTEPGDVLLATPGCSAGGPAQGDGGQADIQVPGRHSFRRCRGLWSLPAFATDYVVRYTLLSDRVVPGQGH